ncbi:hypothetical protein CB0940_10990 [Cercospora beticola]|uniref:Uncharacterized protein n=2 Tax=Cercospora beticola TaxID=122368 RepID=A0A2G5HDJ2_CERBT|nr:hypothetical protein CB0940_10990 [Cercospora beticola]PIA90333.1 hypothetical protein CB0940_10990 [Cercospora beticola]
MSPLVSPRRRYRSSAAHSSPYETGRRPGALGGTRRRATHTYPQDWELRDPRSIHELDSEGEYDEHGHGVVLNEGSDRIGSLRTSDKLYFDGYDLGQDRRQNRGGTLYDDRAYYDDISEEEDEQYQQSRSYAARDREEALLHTALDRISRARREGKGNVSLSMDEMAALERRNGQRLEHPPTQALVSPPATPAKAAKEKEKAKSSSRSSSSTSLKNQKGRKGSTSSLLFGSPAKSNSKTKQKDPPSRKNSDPQALSGYPPRESMIPGPNGVMYAPVTYFNPPSPELARAHPSSRSSSKHSRRESTPPEMPPIPPRYIRPESSGSLRSQPPDDADWYAPPSRTRSASTAQQWAAYDYDMAPPLPAAQGRRNVSGPPAPGHPPNPPYPTDVRYASLRRAPASSSPLAPQRGAREQYGSGLRRVETSSSDSSDGQGVQIDVLDHPRGGGYSIRQTSPLVERENGGSAATATGTGSPAKGSSPARKRKGSRR